MKRYQYITAKCPFCDKKFEAQVTWQSELHRQVAQDKVQRLYEGHVVNCYLNPDSLKSAPIPLPEYIEEGRDT